MVDENMSNAARVHAIESGKDVRARTLVAFGGAAPLHAARVAEKLGIDRVLIPANAGVGSAVGFLRAPVAYEIVRSNLQRLAAFDAATANRILDEMRAAAAAIVRQGAGDAPLAEQRAAFMRLQGAGARDCRQPAGSQLYADGRRAAHGRVRGGLSRALSPYHPGRRDRGNQLGPDGERPLAAADEQRRPSCPRIPSRRSSGASSIRSTASSATCRSITVATSRPAPRSRDRRSSSRTRPRQ